MEKIVAGASETLKSSGRTRVRDVSGCMSALQEVCEMGETEGLCELDYLILYVCIV
jgi:hypothetical protein